MALFLFKFCQRVQCRITYSRTEMAEKLVSKGFSVAREQIAITFFSAPPTQRQIDDAAVRISDSAIENVLCPDSKFIGPVRNGKNSNRLHFMTTGVHFVCFLKKPGPDFPPHLCTTGGISST
eukprot:scpid108288/ scgid10101/ 